MAGSKPPFPTICGAVSSDGHRHMLWQVGPGACWIMPRASLAAYVAGWLAEAMIEIG